jgi:Tol biopolymer transport system component
LIAYLDYGDNLDEGYIRIVDVNTQQVMQVTTVKRGGVYPILAWASDSELLYYQDAVILFDYRTGQKSKLLEKVVPSWQVTTRPLQIVAAVPKQNLIAVASGEVLVVLERNQDGLRILKQLEGLDNSALAFSPDGSALVYVSGSTQQIKIVSVRGDEPVIELPQASRGTAWSMAWSPDSTSIVYADSDGVHLVNRDGSGLQKIEGVPSNGSPRFAWSQHGSLILSANVSGVSFTLFSLPILAR